MKFLPILIFVTISIQSSKNANSKRPRPKGIFVTYNSVSHNYSGIILNANESGVSIQKCQKSLKCIAIKVDGREKIYEAMVRVHGS
jgi:hypothetical protein